MFCENMKYLYFTIMEVNVIGVIDIEKEKIEYIIGPKKEKSLLNSLYGGICKWEDYLILAPYNASKIWIYNIPSKEWREIGIPTDATLINRKGECFSGIELVDDKVYLFGYGISCILEMDLRSFKTNILVRFDEVGLKGMKLWAKSYVLSNRTLYLAVNDSNIIIKINCVNKSIDLIEIGSGKKLAGITEGSDAFWVVSYLSEELMQWNEKKKSINVILLPKKIDVWGAEFFHGDLYLFHPQYNTISYNTKRGDFNECDFKAVYIKRITDQKVCLSSLGGLKIVSGKGLQKDEIMFDISISDDEINNMFTNISVSREDLIKETDVFNLNNFIKAI